MVDGINLRLAWHSSLLFQDSHLDQQDKHRPATNKVAKITLY